MNNNHMNNDSVEALRKRVEEHNQAIESKANIKRGFSILDLIVFSLKLIVKIILLPLIPVLRILGLFTKIASGITNIVVGLLLLFCALHPSKRSPLHPYE